LSQVSTRGLALIRSFEGCKLKAYKDAAGVWTIGYGTTRIAGKPVKPSLTISQAEAEILLQHQVAEHWNAAEKHILYANELAQDQIDALASFVYNVGVTAFKESTLLKLLNKGQDDHVADEFLKWTKAGGKILRGLIRRRKAERELFLRGMK
jgi:GH24 family phage-related lysozyme (muramidase)